MANRAYKRNVATLENELVLLQGVISISGSSVGGVAYPVSASIVSSLTGSSTQLTAGVVHTDPGSFIIVLNDVYPRLQSAQFTLFAEPGTGMTVVGNVSKTMMGAFAAASGSSNTSQVGFFLCSGSGGVYEPTGSVQVHVALSLKNSTV